MVKLCHKCKEPLSYDLSDLLKGEAPSKLAPYGEEVKKDVYICLTCLLKG